MSKEKQIEGMAKILCGMKNGCDGCMWDKVHCNERNYAEEIYNAGYRKATEVAEEIFSEIEAEIDAALTSNYNFIQQHELLDALWSRVNGKIDALRGIDGFLAELRKKYTEARNEQRKYLP